ncbi:MAG: RNA polymerase sigma factor SigJ, partial [Luteitalea sp.]|nr:RNA polymerase sigma factor SigJ [Luteitalea sp.]
TDERRAAIRDVGAWLTTVVANLCIDRLRSIAARRERYIGPWLPEPIISPVDAKDDPLDEVVRDEQVRIASMVVLQELSPAQ